MILEVSVLLFSFCFIYLRDDSRTFIFQLLAVHYDHRLVCWFIRSATTDGFWDVSFDAMFKASFLNEFYFGYSYSLHLRLKLQYLEWDKYSIFKPTD